MTLKNVQGVMGSCTHFKNITIDKNVKTGLLKDGVRVKIILIFILCFLKSSTHSMISIQLFCRFIFIFNYICVCMCAGACTYACRCPQKTEVPDPLKLELQ